MLLVDFVWAISIKAISNDKMLVGALTASFLVVMNSLVTISYIKDPILIIPAALGAFVGVMLSSLWKKK